MQSVILLTVPGLHLRLVFSPAWIFRFVRFPLCSLPIATLIHWPICRPSWVIVWHAMITIPYHTMPHLPPAFMGKPPFPFSNSGKEGCFVYGNWCREEKSPVFFFGWWLLCTSVAWASFAPCSDGQEVNNLGSGKLLSLIPPVWYLQGKAYGTNHHTDCRRDKLSGTETYFLVHPMSLSFLLHHSTCAVRLQLESTTWIGTGTGTGTGTETETGRRRKGLFIPYGKIE